MDINRKGKRKRRENENEGRLVHTIRKYGSIDFSSLCHWK